MRKAGVPSPRPSRIQCLPGSLCSSSGAGCTAEPEGLSLSPGSPARGSAPATQWVLLPPLALVLWERSGGGTLKGERQQCPEHPARSGGSTVKRESVLKTFWGMISFPAPSPCLCVCLQLSPVPGCSPVPRPSPSHVVWHSFDPLVVRVGTCTGLWQGILDRLEWGELGKRVPIFPPCCPASPAPQSFAWHCSPAPAPLRWLRAELGVQGRFTPPGGRFVPGCCLLLFPAVSARSF